MHKACAAFAKKTFINFKIGNFCNIMIADENKLNSCGMSDVKLRTYSSHQVSLKVLRYGPDFQNNLLTAKVVMKYVYKVIFEKETCNRTLLKVIM